MPTYALTGGLGSGKTLSAVGRIKDYLALGKRVATNLDLDLTVLLPARSKVCTVRLSDFPTYEDLKMIGRGHYVEEKKAVAEKQRFARGSSSRAAVDGAKVYSKNEKHNGLLVFDETAVYLNSRDWSDKGRPKVIAWLRHLRKLGWDCIYILQDIDSMDKQIRKGMIEHEGICKRTDRFSVPLIGGALRMFGLGFISRPPRVHICSVKYGLNMHAPVVDRWVYRGVSIQNAYDTNQVFHDHPVLVKDSTVDDVDAWCLHVGIHSVLSPWHVLGRHLPPPPIVQLQNFLVGKEWRPYVVRKVKHPIVVLLEKLPVSERLKHWKRLEALGAFQTPPHRWKGAFSQGMQLCVV